MQKLSIIIIIIGLCWLGIIVYYINHSNDTMYMITEYSPEGSIINTIYTNNWKYNTLEDNLIVKDFYSNKEYILHGTCQIEEFKNNITNTENYGN